MNTATERADQCVKYVAASYGATDSKTFITATFKLLQTATPGSFISAMLRQIGTRTPLWISSNGVRLKNVEAIEDFYCNHPCYKFLVEHPACKILTTKGAHAEAKELITSRFYRSYMLPMGWRHAVSLCFWERPILDGPVCIFSIYRTAVQGDFSAAEVRLLEKLYRLIDHVRRRTNKLQAERSTLRTLGKLVSHLPLATAVLDWDLHPIYCNLAGRSECHHWRQGNRNSNGWAFKLPEDLMQACWTMKREWCDLLRSEGRSRGIKREVKNAHENLRATIELISPNGATVCKPTFLLQFVSNNKVKATALVGEKNLSLLARLTPEERLVAELICEGQNNDEIATRLFKSLSTVKRQIYSIFQKLAVKSRTELAMRLLTSSGLTPRVRHFKTEVLRVPDLLPISGPQSA